MIFRDENDIKPFYPVSITFKFENLRPIIENQAEPKLEKLIGTPMYQSLVNIYKTDPKSFTAIQNELFRRCRNMVAQHAFAIYIPIGSVSIQETGISVPENNNFKPASQYKIEALRATALAAADAAEESVLKYLEDNSGVFSTWASSSSATEYKDSFIRNATEFNSFHPINESRRLFRAIYPTMKRLERDLIVGAVGQEVYDELKLQHKTDVLTTANKLLLPYIQTAVAKATIGEAVNELVIRVTPDGLLQYEVGETQNMNIQKTANTVAIEMFAKRAQEIAAGHIKSMKDFMEKNIDNYATYKNGTTYIDPSTATDGTDGMNDSENGLVIL
jgi:hypothetical protein